MILPDPRPALRARLGTLEPPAFVEFLVLCIVCAAVIGGTYVALNGRDEALLSLGYHFFAPALALDRHIPLVPQMVWVYVMYFPAFFAITAMTAFDRRVMYEGTVAFTAVALLCMAVFYWLPSRMEQPDLSLCKTASCWMLDRMYQSDNGFHIFPSEHVAYPSVTWLFLRRYLPAAAVPFGFLALGIMASTVLLKRHYLVDIPAGMIAATIGYAVGCSLGRPLARRMAPFVGRSPEVAPGISRSS